MIIKRTFTAVTLAATIFLILFFSHTTIGSLFFLIVLNLFVGFGLYEFYGIVEKKGSTSLMAYGIVAGIAYCTFSFFTSQNSLAIYPTEYLTLSLFLLIMGFFVLQMVRRDESSVIYNFSGTIVGMIYVAWLFAFVAKINYFEGLGLDGRWYVVFLIIVTKGADMFAYLVGSRFGRIKLAPKISPAKSLEGAAAGLIGGVLLAVGSRPLLSYSMTIVQALTVGAILSVVGQFGDIAESLLKRDAGVKDSGVKFPGFGGILDLVDSVLFTMPVMYYLMKFWLVAGG